MNGMSSVLRLDSVLLCTCISILFCLHLEKFLIIADYEAIEKKLRSIGFFANFNTVFTDSIDISYHNFSQWLRG